SHGIGSDSQFRGFIKTEVNSSGLKYAPWIDQLLLDPAPAAFASAVLRRCASNQSKTSLKVGATTLPWSPPGISRYLISAPSFLPVATMTRDRSTGTVGSLSPCTTSAGMCAIFDIAAGLLAPPEIGARAANTSGWLIATDH